VHGVRRVGLGGLDPERLHDEPGYQDGQYEPQGGVVFRLLVEPGRLDDVPPVQRHEDADDAQDAEHVGEEGQPEVEPALHEPDACDGIQDVRLEEDDGRRDDQGHEPIEDEQMEYALVGFPDDLPVRDDVGNGVPQAVCPVVEPVHVRSLGLEDGLQARAEPALVQCPEQQSERRKGKDIEQDLLRVGTRTQNVPKDLAGQFSLWTVHSPP